MLPVIKGDDTTLQLIVAYSFLLVISSLLLFVFQAGWFYLIVALIIGVRFILKSLKAHKYRTEKNYRALFGYSIAYLFVLFITIVLDDLFSRFLL